MSLSPEQQARLRRVAGKLRVSRDVFAGTYDEFVRSIGGPKALSLKVRAVYAESDDDAAAFYEGLVQADELGWLEPLLTEVHRLGWFDDGAPTHVSTPESPIEPKPGLAREPEITVELQGIISRHLPNLDMEKITPGLLRAVGRVCRVVVDGGTVTGTGFLVGPQTVVTSWHVVQSLLTGADHQPARESAEKISVEFDLVGSRPAYNTGSRFHVTDQWLVAASPCHPTELPRDSDRSGRRPDGVDVGGYLDYAILRLDGTPGRERGSYRLDPERWPTKGPTCVVHHPAQFSQRAAFGDIVEVWPGEKGARVVHNAGTGYGSSGGVVLDGTFEAIALHQCALRDETDQLIGNGAISIAPIAAAVQTGGVLEVVGTCDPLWCLPEPGQPPVFGRERFQQLLWRARASGPHIIVVTGPRETGKSFSARILQAALPVDENVVVTLGAAAIPADATALAEQILRAVEPPASAENAPPLPSRGDATSTYAVWIKDTLFTEFARRLNQAAGDRLVWLVIDDLEHHTLPDASARVFLQVLYTSLASTLPSTRVILIGLDGPVPGVDSRSGVRVEHDRIDRPSVNDVATYLRRVCVARAVAVSNEEALRHADTAVRAADWLTARIGGMGLGAGPPSPVQSSSFVSVLSQHVSETTLKAFFP
jgi:hypothetical protein